jgi:membrane protease subunit HflK
VAIYDEYRRAPEVTRKRIYLETLNDILPRVSKKIIIDNDLDSVLPLLNLDSWKPKDGDSK